MSKLYKTGTIVKYYDDYGSGYRDMCYIQGDGYHICLTDWIVQAGKVEDGDISNISYRNYTEEFLINVPEDRREAIIKSLLSRDKNIVKFTLDIIKSYE
jgi:hypothetical protein